MREQQQKTILVIGEQSARRALLRDALCESPNSHYLFIEKQDGEEGARTLKSQPVDLIVWAGAAASAREWLEGFKAQAAAHPPAVVLLEEENALLAEQMIAAGAQCCLPWGDGNGALWRQMLRSLLDLADRLRASEERYQKLQARHQQFAESVLLLEDLSQAVIDSLPEQVAVLDKTGKIVAVNRVWQEEESRSDGIAGLTGAAVGDNYLKICERIDRQGAVGEEINSSVRAVLSGERTHFYIEYPSYQQGEERWFLMNVTPLPRVRGGAVVTHLNITERKQSEKVHARLLYEAQEARESAESANRAKDEFIAQVSHDLRSPLNAIFGWTKMLRTRQVDRAILEEGLDTIQKSAEKQKHLIDDLLDVSRIITGKLKLDVRPLSLSAVIRSALEIMMPACEAKGIICESEFDTEADAITGDPERLEQVIWNLISNAVKHTSHGGMVKVRLERADPYVRITVSDTGRGINPEHLPYIFNRHWQGEGSGKRRGGGLGLGLSMVRHIVELHGGTVEAQSEGEGKGATFIINLPYRAVRVSGSGNLEQVLSAREKEAELLPLLDAQPASAALSGLLILVVDDERDARELVSAILRQHGADVVTAGSSAEALSLLKDSDPPPALLVSDIGMPDEEGYELIRKVRQLPAGRGGQIPAIALTAFGRMQDRIRALSAGFQMHLPKPIEPAELVLIAANLTGRELPD